MTSNKALIIVHLTQIRSELVKIVSTYCKQQAELNNSSLLIEHSKLATRLYIGIDKEDAAVRWFNKVLFDDSELLTGTTRVMNKIINLIQ